MTRIVSASGLVTRRHFLTISAAGVATVAGLMNTRAFAQETCETGGPLNLFTFDGYQGTGVPGWDELWNANGIEPNVRPIAGEDLLALFRAPGGDVWDAFSINQGDNVRYHEAGVLSPITVEELPNLAKLYSALADNPLWKISDGVYNSVPLTIGPLGINWITEKYPDGINSYALALDPQYRVGALDSPGNMIPTATCAVGLDPAQLTREQLNGPVRDWLIAARPQIKVVAPSIGDQLTVLLNGDVDFNLVGFPWNILQARKQGIELSFGIPSEGSYGYVDSVGIPPWSKNRCNALVYARAALDPALAAPLNDALVGLGATPEINAALSPETSALFPQDIENDFFAKLKWNVAYTDPDGDYATYSEWETLWNEVKVGT